MSRPGHENTYENNSPDRRVAQLAAEQWGIVDNADLRACGLSANAVTSRVRRGHLHRIHPGVYALGHAALSLNAGSSRPSRRPAGSSAIARPAVKWKLFHWDEHWLPEVTVCTSHTRIIPGIIIHRTRRPLHVVRFDGIPVTTAARALIDISPTMPFDPLRRAVREGLALKRVTLKELVGGSKELRAIVADGYVPTRSEFEDAVHDLLKAGGIQLPVVGKLGPDRREVGEAGLPLAAAAADPRGRWCAVARPSARPRGRRRAAGAARGRG